MLCCRHSAEPADNKITSSRLVSLVMNDNMPGSGVRQRIMNNNMSGSGMRQRIASGRISNTNASVFDDNHEEVIENDDEVDDAELILGASSDFSLALGLPQVESLAEE